MKEIIRMINNKTVESSLGWRIRVPSIHHLKYEEHEKIIEVEIEGGTDEKSAIDWAIYEPVVWRWKNMNCDDSVGPEKIAGILDRIRVAFDKLDMKIKEII